MNVHDLHFFDMQHKAKYNSRIYNDNCIISKKLKSFLNEIQQCIQPEVSVEERISSTII